MQVARRSLPWQKIENQVVIIHPETQEALELNEVATHIWECIGDDGASISEILNNLMEEFEVNEGEAHSDLRNFVDVMKDKKLLEV